MAASQDQSAQNTLKPIATISSGHESTITSIAWLSGDRIVTGSYDGTVRIWNSTDGSQEGMSMVHEGPVWQIVVTKDGRIVSRCHRARHLIVWNADTQQLIEGLWSDDDHGQLEQITLSRNGELLASCHETRIVFWEMSGTIFRNFIRKDSISTHSRHICAVCLSPTGTRIAVSDGDFFIVDVESGELIFTFPPLGGFIRNILWTHDGARLFCANRWDGIFCFNSETGESTGKSSRRPKEVGCVSLSPDGKCFASSSFGGTIRFWDVKTDNPVGRHLTSTSDVSAIAFSPSGEFLATGGEGKEISIWRIPWWSQEALNPLLDTSAVVSLDAGGPSNDPDLDFLDIPEPRHRNPPQGRSIQNPSDDPARVQSSVLPRRWWKRIPRLVFRRSYTIYPASGPSRLGVASSSTVDNNQRSHSRTTHAASGHSSSEESSEGSSDTPPVELEPEVGEAGCCGLWSRPRTRATADRAREDVPTERSLRRTHPSESNNASLPVSTSAAMQDILELSAIVRSTDTP